MEKKNTRETNKIRKPLKPGCPPTSGSPPFKID